MLAVAMGKVFRTAMLAAATPAGSGRPGAAVGDRPARAVLPRGHRPGPPAAPAAGLGGAGRAIPLDPELPEWGNSRYLTVRLTGQARLADALSHLYVLLPVLDDSKHYWVDDTEIDKLLRAGGEWLPGHPNGT